MSYRPPPLPEPCPHCGGRQPEIFHTSCRMRAAWSPAQRRAFDLADDRRELREALERRIPLPEMTDAYLGPTPIVRNCSVPGCSAPSRARGMCEMHYRRDLQGRELLAARRAPRRRRAA